MKKRVIIRMIIVSSESDMEDRLDIENVLEDLFPYGEISDITITEEKEE